MMIAHDKLIIITGRGRLIVAETSSDSFQEISSADIFGITDEQINKRENVCWTMPVFSNGHVYVRATNGDVACVDMR